MATSEAGIFSELLSMLFPLHCVHCGMPGTRLCDACEQQLAPIGSNRCRCCGRPGRNETSNCDECRGRRFDFRSARSLYCYSGPARSLVHGLKYGGQRRMAALMAELSCNYTDLTEACKGATLTYVPMHRSGKSERGYNQAELYARALGRRMQLPCIGLLKKKYPTRPQNQLNFRERRNNLTDSIGLARRCRYGGGRVVLVDDVFTTGSTASECARVLRGDLNSEVDVWTFARAVRR